MVYFVRHLATGEIKIGFSRGVPVRMQYLLREVGPIELLAVEPGTVHDEHAYHACLAEHRLHGEWFAPCSELLEYIGSVESCEPVGVIEMAEIPPFEFRKTPEDPVILPRWLTVDGGAAERGLPLRPPLDHRR